jgi:three-Cys-motif partner protein
MAEDRTWGGAWTEAKINALRDYLRSYQTALKKTSFHRTYIDALAGDGTWRKRRTSAEPLLGLDDSERAAAASIQDGTALAAIDVEPPFDRYVFNDLDPGKATTLRRRAAEHGLASDAVRVKATDANEFVQDFCRTLNRRTQRGVILLDPWGMQINWSAVQSIAETRCLDMWYLFPTQAVVRMLPRGRLPSDSWCDKLDLCLGVESWREEFYWPAVSVDDLFGQRDAHIEREASFAAVERFLILRLKETFAGTVLDEPLRLGPRKKPIFSFCFATANPSDKATQLASRLARGVVKANKADG